MTGIYRRMKWRGLAAAAALAATAAVLTATLATSGAGAKELRGCAGKVSGDHHWDDVMVSAGDTCDIQPGARVTLSGDIRVQANATLAISHGARDDGKLIVGRDISIAKGGRLLDAGRLHVMGDVTADDAQDVYLFDMAQVDGDVKVGPWTRAVWIAHSSIEGTVSIDRGHLEKEAGLLSINDSDLGALLIKDNKNVFAFNVSDNRIDKRLECVQDRSQGFNFDRNTVNGKQVGADACRVR